MHTYLPVYADCVSKVCLSSPSSTYKLCLQAQCVQMQLLDLYVQTMCSVCPCSSYICKCRLGVQCVAMQLLGLYQQLLDLYMQTVCVSLVCLHEALRSVSALRSVLADHVWCVSMQLFDLYQQTVCSMFPRRSVYAYLDLYMHTMFQCVSMHLLDMIYILCVVCVNAALRSVLADYVQCVCVAMRLLDL